MALTQDAHVVFALLLVRLDEAVEGVREVLEERVLLVHLQPQDAVQELGDGAIWWAGGEGAQTASGGALAWEGWGSSLWGWGACAQDSPFSTSRQPDLDSRPPMPTDSRPCFMSAEGRASNACCPALAWALPSQPRVFPAPGAPLVSEGGRSLWAQIWSTNPSTANSSGSSCPPPETLALPQLTPEKSGISSGIGLGQRHLVLSLAQDGGEHAAEGPGAVLHGRVRRQKGLARGLDLGKEPLSRPPPSPGTLFSKLYLLRSRDSVARRSP